MPGSDPAIRSFLAIPLGGTALAAVHGLLARLRGTGADVAWSRPEQVHLTLKFLGGVAPARLDALQARLAEVLAGHRAFVLAVARCGAFPALTHPRVLWVGVSAPGLAELAAAVDDACAVEGFAREERAFHPHMTLGRVRSKMRRGGARHAPPGVPAEQELVRICQAHAEADFGESPVETVTLFRSDLGRGGARHSALAEIPLARAGRE